MCDEVYSFSETNTLSVNTNANSENPIVIQISLILIGKCWLTFHPEVGCAADARGGHEVSGALARVVGVVDDAVQLGAGPLVDVEVEGRCHGLEVVLGKVWRLLALADGVPLVVVADVGAVLEPDDVAEWRTLHLTFDGEVSDLGHRSGVWWKSGNERRWS